MTVYKLYVLKPDDSKIEDLVEEYKYVRASMSYALVYTNKKAPKNGILVERPQVLSPAEKAWVMACNMQIEDELLRNSKNAEQAMESFLKDLEAELIEMDPRETGDTSLYIDCTAVMDTKIVMGSKVAVIKMPS